MVTKTVTMRFKPEFDAEAHSKAVDAEQRQAYETAGNLAALLDALRHLQRAHPHWATEAACRELEGFALGWGRRNKSGRHAHWSTQHAQDRIDFRWYQSVEDFRRAGVPRDDVWELVSKHHRRTDHHRSPDAVRLAHARVKRRLRTNPGRYYFSPMMTLKDRPAHLMSRKREARYLQALSKRVEHLRNTAAASKKSRKS
jgi:hypothetical protein